VYTPRAYRCYTSLLNVHDFYTHISTFIYLCVMYMYFYISGGRNDAEESRPKEVGKPISVRPIKKKNRKKDDR